MLEKDEFATALEEMAAIRRDLAALSSNIDNLASEVRDTNADLAKLVHAQSASGQMLE